jgi:carbon-monoxide dehydrogenase small subunit
MRVQLTVNGVDRIADGVWELDSLLNLLREHLGLRGTKNACEQGECGSCSVYLDGTLVCSCLVAAAQADGRTVVTVEGLGSGEDLHPIQEALIEAGGVQCGFCTPGMVVAAHALLERDGRPDELTVREELAGNLCRCTGYEKILAAVNLAVAKLGGES